MMNRVLAVRGQVVPASSTPLVLHAELRDGREVVGQSRIAATSGIERVWLTPDGVGASADAVAAITEADLIVIGPGSLFTSVLPSLLLPEIRAALLASPAPRIYVCNVATQPGETTGLRPGRPRRGARAARLERDRRHRPRQQPLDRRPGTGGAGRPSRARRSGCAGHPRSSDRRSSFSTTSSIPTTRATTTRPGSRRRSSASPSTTAGPAAGAVRSPGPRDPARRRRRRPTMTTAERDLVSAIRTELASIVPQRACDRAAESAGLGSPLATREAAVARLAVRLGGEPTDALRPAGARRRTKHLRVGDPGDAGDRSTGRPPRTTAGSPGCAGGSCRADRSAWPPGGPISSSSSRRPRRRSSRAVSPTSGCRRRGGCAAAGVS